MGLKSYKPTSPARRSQTTSDFSGIEKGPSVKRLLKPKKRTGGRNVRGKITTRHRGGGHKKHHRIIDFTRRKDDIQARVAGIEYDPNRSANIALLNYCDGEKRYILAPAGLSVGDEVMSGNEADIRPGNTLPLKSLPLGTLIHNLEIKEGKGAQLIRSAGTSGQLMAKEGKYAHVRLPTGEVRMVHQNCRATVGQVGNIEHENISIGKAGRTRWLGFRPKVRGVAMNPVDHPMGGGEGKSSGGRHPVSPWGKPAKGGKTRKKRKPIDKYIVKKRRK